MAARITAFSLLIYVPIQGLRGTGFRWGDRLLRCKCKATFRCRHRSAELTHLVLKSLFAVCVCSSPPWHLEFSKVPFESVPVEFLPTHSISKDRSMRSLWCLSGEGPWTHAFEPWVSVGGALIKLPHWVGAWMLYSWARTHSLLPELGPAFRHSCLDGTQGQKKPFLH